MNSLNQQFERLLKSASRAPRPAVPEAPFALQTRVLAHWRSLPAGTGDLANVLLPLLRRAALCACVLMLLSLAFSYRGIVAGEDEAVTLANSALDLSLLP